MALHSATRWMANGGDAPSSSSNLVRFGDDGDRAISIGSDTGSQRPRTEERGGLRSRGARWCRPRAKDRMGRLTHGSIPIPLRQRPFGSGSTGHRTGLVTQGRAHCQGEKGGVGLRSRLSLRQFRPPVNRPPVTHAGGVAPVPRPPLAPASTNRATASRGRAFQRAITWRRLINQQDGR